MDFNSIFKDSTNIINSIKQIISNDKELSNLLAAAGGIFSIIGFSLEMYKKIKDKMQTDEQKALLSLIHIALEITERILNDIQNNKEFNVFIFKQEINKKELVNELLNSFASEENWNEVLIEHPAIKEFKKKIRYILSNNIGLDNKTINYYFRIKFDNYLVEECKKNEQINKILELRLIDEKYENTIKLLEYSSNQNNIISPYNNKPLSEYFIEQDAIITDYTTWEKDEDVFRDLPKEEIYRVIDKFLNNNEKFLVIGATYGIGKTSLSKMIASKYSNQLLELDESIFKNLNYSNYGEYFPIIIYLRIGLKSEFNDWSLKYLFNEIIGNDNESKKRRILLILDGLDEYPYDIDKLLTEEVQHYTNDYKNLKIILTTRLLPGLNERLSNISNKEYIRLLSFTPDKVTELFERYMNEEQKSDLKRKYGIGKLTFDYVSTDIGITNDKNFEIKNPLFAWMLILLYTSSELKIEFKENWSIKFRKSLIYLFFVHYVIGGKYKEAEETFNLKKTYYIEKKSLRIIAKLKQLRKNELLWTECEREIKSFFGSNVNMQILESILHTYFFSPFQTTDRKVDFIHKTFMEYLVAEHYIECVLFGNEVAVNIGKPSYTTIEFLDGLIEILNSNDEDTKNKFVNYNESDQITLLNSFNYTKSQNNALIDIRDACLNCVTKKGYCIFQD